MIGKVFISYRRDDSAGYAGRVHDRLEREFGSGLLFMDVDSISLGANFVKVIRNEVAKCHVLLAVIGPNWLNATDENGGRRLDNPHDFVRVEIAAALQREIPVIPILLDGARIPKSSELPEDLLDLTMHNGLEVRHASFHGDTNRLVKQLNEPAAEVAEREIAPKASNVRPNKTIEVDADTTEREQKFGSPNDAKTLGRTAEPELPAQARRRDAGSRKTATNQRYLTASIGALLATSILVAVWSAQRQDHPATVTSPVQPASTSNCDQQDVFDQTITGSIPGMSGYIRQCPSGPYTDRVRAALESQLYESASDCVRSVCSWQACLTSYANFFPSGARLASLRSQGEARMRSTACGGR